MGSVIGGRYLLRDGPFAGARGEVWSAYDTRLDRKVALKQVRSRVWYGHAERARNEAGILGKVSHPNLAAVYDIVPCRGGNEFWWVSEHLPESMAGKPPIPLAEAAEVGAQIAGALAALHVEGHVYGDVTPDSIGIADDGTVKLTGLDVVRQISGLKDTIDADVVICHSRFAAPEVLRGFHPEPASDVFSLGATIYALVVGRSPCDSEVGSATGAVRAAGTAQGSRGDAVRAEADVGPLRDVLVALLQADFRDRPEAVEAQKCLREGAAAHGGAESGVALEERVRISRETLIQDPFFQASFPAPTTIPETAPEGRRSRGRVVRDAVCRPHRLRVVSGVLLCTALLLMAVICGVYVPPSDEESTGGDSQAFGSNDAATLITALGTLFSGVGALLAGGAAWYLARREHRPPEPRADPNPPADPPGGDGYL
ncbi:serine/threonine-protein kinase [Streptomyces iranensis]|uniref:Serine/threonine protein kinase n=1 Tax=Streptomyces iranensis TaxID=576784 RepID=A0A060ZMF7_9ACTN|nr:serine/threonine-protein kinase [Streptomyces iranensis]MBP2062413.1 serine/threonine protein kinase [Streptomyces iranensis]CDR07377.1 Serine/threonine protein kinase-like protein [Streptomyces iranensis]